MTSGPDVPDSLMSQFSDFIALRLGLHFPPKRWRDLERGVHSALQDFAQPDTRTCIEWLLSRTLMKSEIELLASHLTVGETYFFREEKSFDALESAILPGLISRRRGSERRLRIWSAGCCTGEEPYSLAILLRRMIPDLDNWMVTLLATDINPRFLRKAENGLYSTWSFRTTPSWVKDRYFKEDGEGRFRVDTQARHQVTFSYLNLAEDSYPSLLTNTNAMDIIFCRNVLMYFSAEHAQRVIDQFYNCLVDGGWLVVSPSEVSQRLFSQFTAVTHCGAILYQKPMDDNHARARREATKRLHPDDFPFFRAQPTPMHFAPETEPPLHAESIAHSFASVELDTQSPDRIASDSVPRLEASGASQAPLIPEPDHVEAMIGHARTLANEGRLVEALAWGEKAIAMDRLIPASHYLLAVILQEQGRNADAVASLKRAVYLDTHFALAHFLLGTLARHQGNGRESEKHFRNALASLDRYALDDYPPESEGTTAGRLGEIIRAMVHEDEAA